VSDSGHVDHPLPLVFPPPAGALDAPVWNGRTFCLGELNTPILEYEVGQSGWTDELTAFHEDTAGADHYIDRASRNHSASQLRKWLSANSPVIIDIGCSSGLMLHVLRDEFPHASLVGADFVRGPLEALAPEFPGVPFLQFDLTKCPLPDDSVDGIVLLNVLEHIEDDGLALSHVARILKPGGVVVIEVPAGPTLYDVYDKLLLHHRRYRMGNLIGKIESAGLQVLEKSHLGFLLYPAFWITKKRGRRYLSEDAETQRSMVSRRIMVASSNPAMHWLMEMEARLRRWVYFPFGIRCLVTCRKPNFAHSR
jgi:ubiquinone/menaquinone biosynthesis C-methylase UbiE